LQNPSFSSRQNLESLQRQRGGKNLQNDGRFQEAGERDVRGGLITLCTEKKQPDGQCKGEGRRTGLTQPRVRLLAPGSLIVPVNDRGRGRGIEDPGIPR